MIRCVMCGYEYEPNRQACSNGCPLAGACHFVCCPRCGYQTLDTAQASSVKFLARVKKYIERVTGKGETNERAN